MSHAVIFLLSLAAFAALLLSMRGHQKQWLSRPLQPPAATALRAGGGLALLIAFAVAAGAAGAAEGAILWCGWLTVAAATVVAANAWRERTIANGRRR